MKLSQARLREIIQEEVARMEARGKAEPGPGAAFTRELKKKYSGDPRKVDWRHIYFLNKEQWLEAWEKDDVALQNDIIDSALIDVKTQLAIPGGKNLEEAKPGDLDQTIAKDPERTIGQQNAIEAVKKEFMDELTSLSGIASEETDIFQFLLQVLKLLKNNNANTSAMRTALNITRKAAEKIAK